MKHTESQLLHNLRNLYEDYEKQEKDILPVLKNNNCFHLTLGLM
mgnify:CR=1 FL=1